MSDALRLQGVGKRYGDRWAVRELSLAVARGALYGLLGPNGAGKTTTIRMAMGILVPEEGSVEVLGAPPGDAVRQRLGYLPEERGLYETMKVGELLVFLARLKGVPPAEGRRRARAGLEELELGEAWDRKLNTLSKGNQQKVQFLATILHEPELVVLDEPASGLDPLNAQVLERILFRIRDSGRTVVLSSHRMDQVERLCSSIALISRGRLVLEGDLRSIKRRHGSDEIRVRFAQDVPPGGGFDWPGVREAGRDGPLLSLRVEPGADSNAILARALALGTVERFERHEPTLEEIFLETAGHTPDQEAAEEQARKEAERVAAAAGGRR